MVRTSDISQNEASGASLAQVAREAPGCVEYLAVHEMTNLLERTHGERFTKLVYKHMPDWRARRGRLDQAPLGHEQWVRP